MISGGPAREEVGYQKSIPIMSDHKSIPIAGRWFPALGIRHKSRDSSYLILLHIGPGVLFNRNTERMDRGVSERIWTLQACAGRCVARCHETHGKH